MVKRPERTSFCSGRFDQTALFNPRAVVACVSFHKLRVDSNGSRPFLDHQSSTGLFLCRRGAVRDGRRVPAAKELVVVSVANFVDTALVIDGSRYPIARACLDVSTNCY
jgi:hypothetical protein